MYYASLKFVMSGNNAAACKLNRLSLLGYLQEMGASSLTRNKEHFGHRSLPLAQL